MKFETKVIHGGQSPDPSTGAIMPPVYFTSTFVQEAIGEHKGYEYARTKNPTRSKLEANLASIENGQHAFAFASGMAATTACLQMLSQGDHVIASSNLYGGTYRVMDQVFSRQGLSFSFVNCSNLDNIEQAITEHTKLLFIETPTNPIMTISDIQLISDYCKTKNLLLVVDNTFATPYAQNPLDFGADIVLHSTTKYLNGHSDSVGGCLIVNDDNLAVQIAFLQNACGAILGPMDAWLVLRGIKTLHLRMRQHEASAMVIASFLESHSNISKVFYPGLPSHPDHSLAIKQMRCFGGMISFDVGSFDNANKIAQTTVLFSLAESLGGVESLISHPAGMTHGSVPHEMREELGITDGLLRISVGIEHTDDLLEDLKQALDI